MKLLTKIFGTRNDKILKQIQPIINRINELEPSLKKLSDAELAAKTIEFRNRSDNGESLDSLLPEAYAVCREGGRRTLDQRHYDVQLVGGIVLHQGKIAEMKTGEGKTLTASGPKHMLSPPPHLVQGRRRLAIREPMISPLLLHQPSPSSK